jgi:hypothetical protein
MGNMMARLLKRTLVALAAISAAPWAAAQATQAAEPIQTVNVRYVRDPVDKSYPKMIKGMDRFERERALAPNATLRFRLLPRLPNSKLDGVTLRVAGDSVNLNLPIAADYSFVLPRNAQALREDAAVVASRKADSMTWRAWVQSPGVTPGTRRLGDLRLECRVGMDAGLVSNTSPMFAWLSNMLTDTDKICNTFDGNYLFFAERPIFGVTLSHGTRREALPFKMLYAGGDQSAETLPFCDCQVLLDRSFYAPIWDRSWPDDTVVEFDYMTDAAVTP